MALLIASLIGGGLYFYLRYSIRNAVDTYTQKAPVELSGIPISEEVRKEARGKGEEVLTQLRKALSVPTESAPTAGDFTQGGTVGGSTVEGSTVEGGTQRAAKEFTVTPLQLEEVLRATLPDLLTERGFQIRGDGEMFSVDFSVSVRTLSSHWESFSRFSLDTDDRFFNGHITLRGGISGGRPDLEIKELVLAGSTLPEMGRTSATSSVREFLKALLAGEVDAGQGLDFTRIQDAKIVNSSLLISLK